MISHTLLLASLDAKLFATLTISSDIIYHAHKKSVMYNNDASIAKSKWLSACKIICYRAFSWMYGAVGSCTHLAMVNLWWTKSHIEALWEFQTRLNGSTHPLLLQDFRNLLLIDHRLLHKSYQLLNFVKRRDLVSLLGNAVAGMHTMIDEHFANNSAAPQMDIVLEKGGQRTGFLVQTVEEYAAAIIEIVKMTETQMLEMNEDARKRAARFSEQHFKTAIRSIFTQEKRLTSTRDDIKMKSLFKQQS